MWSWLQPKPSLAEREVDRGLRLLVLDGAASQVMAALTGGALLVAYALHLGASNKVIGLIAALGPLTQVMQLPAILLVERSRRRKALVLASSFAGRLCWLPAAALPWLLPEERRLPALLVCLVAYYASTAIANPAFNSWKRDLLPETSTGRFLADRLAVATAAGAVVLLASGFAIDHAGAVFDHPLAIYGVLISLGGLAGLAGVGFLAGIPEPRMALEPQRSLVAILSEPLHHENFRKLLIFLGSWNFAINLAAPFFTVYMLQRLQLPMTWVLGLSVVSQVSNISLYRVWGELADRLGNKAVLGLSGWLFVVCIGMWPFTTLPERYFLTIPLLIAIHVLAGISTAGVNLCASGITLKLAPRGKATAFLAVNALISGLAATVAPAVAGFSSDWFASRRLSVELEWSTAAAPHNMTAVDLSGLDFLFVAAVIFGLYSLHRLLAVREEGVIEDAEITAELYDEVLRAVRNLSSVAGLRRLVEFPYSLLRSRGDPPSAEEPTASTTKD